MTEKERIINCMSPLVAALDKADPEWAIFGSAALALCGMDRPVADIDIILSPEGAARMEQEWHSPLTKRVPHRASSAPTLSGTTPPPSWWN